MLQEDPRKEWNPKAIKKTTDSFHNMKIKNFSIIKELPKVKIQWQRENVYAYATNKAYRRPIGYKTYNLTEK